MSLLPEPEGRSPTETARLFSHNMKEYTLLKEPNKVARLCKELHNEGFLKIVERAQKTGKKGAQQKYYAVDQINFLRVMMDKQLRAYNPNIGLNVFTSLLKNNKVYYDARLTNIQDYFLVTLSAIHTDNPDKNTQAINDAIELIVYQFNQTGKIQLIFEKHENTEILDIQKRVTFLYFYLDYMIKLYESSPSRPRFEERFAERVPPKHKNDIRLMINNYEQMKQSMPMLPRGFARYRH
jgi:hypothetical protein